MKIALLNLKYDNNYGGNLQRYALVHVLQMFGHEVTHINLRFSFCQPWYKKPYKFAKQFIKKYLLGKDVFINEAKHNHRLYEKRCATTEPFYQQYIPHSGIITDTDDLKKCTGYDAYVVGSDQVWRKQIAQDYISSMFFDFVPKDSKAKRIAYGVSLGVSDNELNKEEIAQLSELYNRFNAVSVREKSALTLLNEYGWTNPQAVHVLDPTLLLRKEDYINLINCADTSQPQGNLFCYILDMTDEKKCLIKNIEKERRLSSFIVSINNGEKISIEQWLRYFNDAEFVITDSYHGLIFSIIFNKPYFLIRNSFRGNARFESVLDMFDISDDGSNVDWKKVDMKQQEMKERSMSFLKNIAHL